LRVDAAEETVEVGGGSVGVYLVDAHLLCRPGNPVRADVTFPRAEVRDLLYLVEHPLPLPQQGRCRAPILALRQHREPLRCRTEQRGLIARKGGQRALTAQRTHEGAVAPEAGLGDVPQARSEER